MTSYRPFLQAMPTLLEIIRKKPHIKERPIESAHRVEYHWVRLKGDWNDGAKALQTLFPREARVERPAEWYSLLRETHWPGKLPPGNGPFYVPEYAIKDDDMRRALERNGFVKVVAHVAVLPPDSEYLVAAMRGAGKHPWTVDPILYFAYFYPKIKGWKVPELRPYNTTPWTP